MFEQSLLIHHPTNKSWSVLVSLTGEIMLIGLALLIPLFFTQHLPQFHLADLNIRPPAPATPKPVEMAHSTPTSAANSAPVPTFVRPDFSKAGRSPVTLFDDSTSPLPPPGLTAGMEVASPFLTDAGPRIPVQAPPEHATPTAPSGPIRVTSVIQMAKLVKQVLPVYPEIARRAHVFGTVQLLGTISRNGTIRNLQVISGNPLLVRAARDAVQQWIYQPTVLNGEAVEVIAPIEVRFILNH